MTALLATDLDGTILFDRRVSAQDLEAMRRWRDAGNLLAICSGKSVFATRDTLEPEGVEFDHAITFTGAVLTDGDYRVISERHLPDGVAHDIVESLQVHDGLTVFATTIEKDYVLSDTYNEVSPILQVFEPLAIDEMHEHRFIGVPMRVRDDDVRDTIVADVTARWGNQVEVIRNQEFLDIVPSGCTKGSGLLDLVARLTAEDGPRAGETIETWTIGDSWNDVPMHLVADHAVALPWSPDDVTAVCERTVGSIAELIDAVLDGAPATPAPAGAPTDTPIDTPIDTETR